MLKALLDCIRRLLSRIKPKASSQQQRRTVNGANIDIEEALAEQLEMQRISGRALSSTASIAAALRYRPRETMPVFSTHLSNNEHREPSDPAIATAVQEMQSLTPTMNRMKISRAKSPVEHRREPSGRLSSSSSSFVKIPEAVSENGEPEQEADTKQKEVAPERQSEMKPRRSSIFDVRSEWI